MATKNLRGIALLLFELFRVFLIISTNSDSTAFQLSWYASIPLLCVVPACLCMLAVDEKSFSLWLPLIGLIKLLGIPSFILFIIKTGPDAIRFLSAADTSLISAVTTAIAIVIFDGAVGIYSYRRYRSLCK
jgi:hypothetical protein